MSAKECAGCDMAVFRCAVRVLRTQRQGFDYNFHNRITGGTSGLYAFWLDTGACLYVGETGDISRRMYQHRMSEHNPKLDDYFRAFQHQIEVSYAPLSQRTAAQRRHLERRLIAVLRPITNDAPQNP